MMCECHCWLGVAMNLEGVCFAPRAHTVVLAVSRWKSGFSSLGDECPRFYREALEFC